MLLLNPGASWLVSATGWKKVSTPGAATSGMAESHTARRGLQFIRATGLCRTPYCTRSLLQILFGRYKSHAVVGVVPSGNLPHEHLDMVIWFRSRGQGPRQNLMAPVAVASRYGCPVFPRLKNWQCRPGVLPNTEQWQTANPMIHRSPSRAGSSGDSICRK